MCIREISRIFSNVVVMMSWLEWRVRSSIVQLVVLGGGVVVNVRVLLERLMSLEGGADKGVV
jgi:hypothetical protein